MKNKSNKAEMQTRQFIDNIVKNLIASKEHEENNYCDQDRFNYEIARYEDREDFYNQSECRNEYFYHDSNPMYIYEDGLKEVW